MSTSFYSSKFWKHLRAAALERDGHECQLCTSKERLVVHHFRPRKMGGPDELFNLLTVCVACHQRFHSWLRQDGLDGVWGPEQDPYWHILTDPKDVARTHKRLIEQYGQSGLMERYGN